MIHFDDLYQCVQSNKNQQKIQQTNNSILAMSFTPPQFAIIKFEQNQILLLHKESKKIYQYFQSSNSINPESTIVHSGLLRPIKYNNGLLYFKQKLTLQAELQVRRRANSIVPFEQDEIINTFQPIIKCIAALHDQNIVFGSISPQNIIITEEDQIKLKDKKIQPKENAYYFHKNSADIKKEDDWMALGQIVLQVATLKKSSKLFFEKQLNHVLQGLIDRFSKGFIFALCVFLKRNKDKFSLILNFLRNEEKFLSDIELNTLYNSIKLERQKRKTSSVSNQNANIYPNASLIKPVSFSVHESPMKKMMMNSLGNNLRKVPKEDSQNKKTPGGKEFKSNKTDRINKIIEKSNEVATDLIFKKNNDQIFKKLAPKTNIANISLFASELFRRKVKEGQIVAPSPNTKIRTVSRKK